MLDIEYICARVQGATGIKIDVNYERLPDQDLIHLRPQGFKPNRGIRIKCSLKWRTLNSKLVFEDYAQDVADHIVTRKERVDVFEDVVESYKKGSKKRVVSYSIEDANSFQFNIEETPIDVSVESLEEHISKQCIDILNAILLFFELKEERTDQTGLPEGAKKVVEVNKYERSRINRAACINHFGPICHACGFDFEKTYGDIGKGFIHVHHIIPASKIGDDYVLNPIRDLIPLCPNCHAIVHKKDPPFEIEEIKEKLDNAKTSINTD